MKGTIGYVLDGVIAGWVSWSSDLPGELLLSQNGAANQPQVTVEITKEELDAGILTQHFRMSNSCVSIDDLRLGAAKVTAVDGDGVSFNLPLWGVLSVAAQIAGFSERQVAALGNWVDLIGAKAKIQVLEDKSQIENAEDAEGARSFGAVSKDGDVIAGRNGFLFLGQGTNRVIDLYREVPGALPQRWRHLLADRVNKLQSMGVDFRQIILPEKSSALPWFCPFPVNGPSEIFLEICRECEAEVGARLLVPTFGTDPKIASGKFQLGDSHLSTAGANLVVSQFLESLNLHLDHGWRFTEDTQLMLGDLATRYAGDNREYVEVFSGLETEKGCVLPRLIDSFDPETGHKGLRRVWSNDLAPFPFKVVAMANSFFERGGASTQLSWWFSRLFKEFHFCWDPELKLSYVEEVRPDYVVCQTVERFLRAVPER